MTYTVVKAANHAKTLLRENPPTTVHSAYRSAINLSCGDMLVSLQPDTGVLSPISLITDLTEDNFSRLPVKAGAQVRLTGDTLFIHTGNLSLAFSLAEGTCITWDLHLEPIKDQARGFLWLDLCSNAFCQASGAGFSSIFAGPSRIETDDPVLTAAKNSMDRAAASFRCGRWSDSARSLAGLIGLGTGLTPAGDDFLCGILAAIYFLGLTDHPFSRCLQESIVSHLRDTNLLSQTFLHCALDGYFSQVVKNAPQAVSGADLYAAFRQIGHSSGMDTLCGIFYGCRLMGPFPNL